CSVVYTCEVGRFRARVGDAVGTGARERSDRFLGLLAAARTQRDRQYGGQNERLGEQWTFHWIFVGQGDYRAQVGCEQLPESRGKSFVWRVGTSSRDRTRTPPPIRRA